MLVIDEAQRRPDLFPILRVLADEAAQPGRFLVLGSASPDLVGLAAESLAGRVALLELGGFCLGDVGAAALDRLWIRGGLPRSYLADDEAESRAWRDDYIATFLERDLANLGVRIPATTMRRFWTMVAHYHGQTWNASELARAFGVSQMTVRGYLDVLVSTFLAWRLTPLHANLSKREVRAPKVYLSDTGVLHTLLGIGTEEDLLGHPKVGASFEGFAIREVVRRLGARPEECHHFSLHSGGELDLVVARGHRRHAFEVKHTAAPRSGRGMLSAADAIGIDRVVVVHAGDATFDLSPRVRAVSILRLDQDLEPLP